MEFLHRSSAATGAIALLPGAFNPPTRAHLAMLGAARVWAAEAVLVLARTLPHKDFSGAEFARRAGWITRLAAEYGFSAAISDGGLFIEMARECRLATGAPSVYLVCGADAAERIVEWDYGAGASVAEQLKEYQLLVAPRGAVYRPPPHVAPRVHRLPLAADWQEVSSTEVRRRILTAAPWAELAPECLVEDIGAAYAG